MPILWNWLGLHLGRVFTMVVGSDVLYILTRPLYNHADFSIFVLLVTEKVMLKSQAMLMDLSVLFNSVATSCIWGVCEQLMQTYIFITHCGLTFYHYQQKEKYFLLWPVFLCVCMCVCASACVYVWYMCIFVCTHTCESQRARLDFLLHHFYFFGGTGSLIGLWAPQFTALAGQWVQVTWRHGNILM